MKLYKCEWWMAVNRFNAVKIGIYWDLPINSIKFGNPTAQKSYMKHFTYRQLQTVSFLPFIATTLERVVFNQVFISQNNQLDANQSDFRNGHSIETALLSITEALLIAKADSKSSVLILLDLSAALWITRSSCPSSHHWDSTSLVWILSHW